MRFFDENFVTNSALHAQWWNEQAVMREFFHNSEENLQGTMAALLASTGLHVNASILPRDAWLAFDQAATRVMRADGGQVWMKDLMELAKPVHIGKLVHMTRVSSDMSDKVVVSMSGQVPVPVDKTTSEYRGAPIPIFAKAFGREWREWNSLQSENFDALADDQEAALYKVQRKNALYVLDGDASISVENFKAYGIRTSPLSKSINLGTGAGGLNVNLTITSPADSENFVTQQLGAVLDANLITEPVNLYVSPEIGRNWDKPYSGVAGSKDGTTYDHLVKHRRINKIVVSHELKGNEFFGFVPSSRFIRPLVGMATNTVAKARINPRDNYQFEVSNALGIDIRADINGKSGVFYSVVVN